MTAASESKEPNQKRNMRSIVSSIHKIDARTAMIDYLKKHDVPVCEEVSLPREFNYKAAQEHPYLVTIVGHNVYKTTNCKKKDYVRQLLREHKVGQKLERLYTRKYPSKDIIVADIQMVVLEQAVILMLVLNKVGISVQSWMSSDPKKADRVSVIEQIDRIHNNFLKIHFFHSDIKPHNILVTLGEKCNIEVSFCDFGLSRFFDSTKSNANIASRCTAFYKLSSYIHNVKCNDYVIVSMFQYVITILSIYLGCSISRIWRCNHIRCSALHIFPPLASKSFLLSMLNVATVRPRQSKAACTCYSIEGCREGSSARKTRVKLHTDLCNVLSNPHACSVVIDCRAFLQSLHLNCKDGTLTLRSE
jgi:serine/threonine protein kinase